jgi:hypothetical protein
MSVVFAATIPERTVALVLYGTLTRARSDVVGVIRACGCTR